MSGRFEEFFNDSKEKLLHVIGLMLTSRGNIGFTKDFVLELYNKRFKILDTPMDNLLDLFVQKSILSESDSKYFLTPEGESQVITFSATYNDYAFSKSLIASDGSEVYKRMSIKIHGRYLGQFDMTDKEQLDKLFSLVNVPESATILDFGCGLGYITEYLQHSTGAHCIGLDIATGALNLARKRNKGNKRLEYIHGDMNNPDFPPSSFDVIIVIDTLYFVGNLYKTLEKLNSFLKPNGKMLIFYSMKQLGNSTDAIFTPDGTKLAQVLHKLDLKYEYYDFTENERRLWKLTKELLDAEKENFLAEGNEVLFNGRMDETQLMLSTKDKVPSVRYLYDIKI